MRLGLLKVVSVGVLAVGVAGATCGGPALEINEFRVELPEPYAPAMALVTGHVTLPPGSGDAKAHVELGDGSSSEVDIPSNGLFSVTHTYEAGGKYTVTATITTATGGEGSVSRQVSVASPVSTVAVECLSCGNDGVCQTLDCTNLSTHRVTFRATATGGVGALRYRWRFGDGLGTEDGEVVSHQYHQGGTYQVTLFASDSLSSGETVEQSVTVPAPTAAVLDLTASPATAVAGDAYTLTIFATGAAPITLIVDWGDTSTSVIPNHPGDGSSAQPTHTYATADAYAIVVSAVDSLGQQAEATRNLTVTTP